MAKWHHLVWWMHLGARSKSPHKRKLSLKLAKFSNLINWVLACFLSLGGELAIRWRSSLLRVQRRHTGRP